MKTSRMTCLAIATLLSYGSFVQAESPTHIDELAVTAERQARQVFYYTYSLQSHGRAAQDLRDDAVQMIRLARHIHELAHVDHHSAHGRHRGHVDRTAHINRDVASLDRLMHHMEDEVVRLKARVPARRPQYGRYGGGRINVSVGHHISLSFGSRGSSRHHHGTSYHAPTTLDRIEISLAKLSKTVHHLLDDTGAVCIRKR